MSLSFVTRLVWPKRRFCGNLGTLTYILFLCLSLNWNTRLLQVVMNIKYLRILQDAKNCTLRQLCEGKFLGFVIWTKCQTWLSLIKHLCGYKTKVNHFMSQQITNCGNFYSCNLFQPLFFHLHMSQLMRLWYLSHKRPAKAQASLRIRAVSPEPSLVAHMKYGSRRKVRPNVRRLVPVDAHLRNEFTEDEKYHNFMRWLICYYTAS